jgi:hypothetical protein
MYCHFCEMRVNNSLSVEHIIARKNRSALASSWNIFLLACASCNSSKLSKKLSAPFRKRYYWPHLNNTLLAFSSPIFGPNALVVTPLAGLSPSQFSRAADTIDLYGLDKKATSTGDADIRFLERVKVANIAIERRIEYEEGKATIPAIVAMAQMTGFFTVWLDVFHNVEVIRRALLMAPDFKIDVSSWFDANLNPIPRNPTDSDPI